MMRLTRQTYGHGEQIMDRATLLKKIFWNLQQPWHFRQHPSPSTLSVKASVKGLQTALLANRGSMLTRTLSAVWHRPITLEKLDQLLISFYQEGADQRVWHAQARLIDGSECNFGLIVARAQGPSSELTQRDFANLQQLYAVKPDYCVTPYQLASLPKPANATVYSVEWLKDHKELVFEISQQGGVFLVNAVGAHHYFSPQMSRRIWRQIMTILWHYPGLRAVNIQAGDFVGQFTDNATEIDLKLTTAREIHPHSAPIEQIHAMLDCAITASGYLSDGKQPFNRKMQQEVFQPRMQAVLQRRFGKQAETMANQQWDLFHQGIFSQQEDGLRQDCILATYDGLCADHPTDAAWHYTQAYWTAYADAVTTSRLPPSWWFPAANVRPLLDQLTPVR